MSDCIKKQTLSLPILYLINASLGWVVRLLDGIDIGWSSIFSSISGIFVKIFPPILLFLVKIFHSLNSPPTCNSSYSLYKCIGLVIVFVILLFAILMMALVWTESTWGKIRHFS